MNTKKLLKLLSLVLVAANATGCAVYDPRDRPWDPAPGRALFEQIPNWDGNAGRRCGGHMDPEVAHREGRSMRC